MEIKAEIINPTETERMNFIVEYNHNKGFEIQEKNIELEDETKELHLQAWGYTDEEIAEQDRERIDNLSLTRADVERAIYADKGMDFDDLLEYVKANVPTMDTKALKIELQANNFYRKHPYICQLGALLGYTVAELDYLFEHKELPEKVTESEE